ncbi:MAG: hypothetical protein QS98_C0009G0007 [archaeon GW2011_AR3]|nr:MAG: hypothetical protein QS98_C0009G0007 [archaeon GW2011_AR3]MBS3110310.1 hypothetical protein [Candidatus Woesearchaeota archaeon]
MKGNGSGKKETSLNDRLNSELLAFHTLVHTLSEKHNISFQQVLESIGKVRDKDKDVLVASYVLRDRKLGILQAVVKYLKEELNFSYHEIAAILNRDDRAIWSSHNHARKKSQERFVVKEPNYWIPVGIFADPRLGPLETLAFYLREKENYGFTEIGNLLNRDVKTIWTSYYNAREKLRGNDNNGKGN